MKCECPISMTDEEFLAGFEGESGPTLSQKLLPCHFGHQDAGEPNWGTAGPPQVLFMQSLLQNHRHELKRTLVTGLRLVEFSYTTDRRHVYQLVSDFGVAIRHPASGRCSYPRKRAAGRRVSLGQRRALGTCWSYVCAEVVWC